MLLRATIPTSPSAVARLLLRGRPSAVAGLVVAIVVGVAVDRVDARWLASHVGQEVLEGAGPTVADRNPATAILLPVRGAGIATAFPHTQPGPVLRADPAGSGVTMNRRPPTAPAASDTATNATRSASISKGFLGFPLEAPTGTSVAGSQMTALNYHRLSAVALTQPADLDVGAWRRGPAQHGQAIKPSPCQLMHGRSIAGG